jgi:hypothetical protein
MKQIFKILAVLILTVAWTQGQITSLSPISGDSSYTLEAKRTKALSLIVSNGIAVTGVDMSGVTINTQTNVSATIVGSVPIANQNTNTIGIVPASVASVTAYNSNLVVKASAGTLISVVGYNSGAAQFVQIHNAASLPANTTAPMFTFTVPATGNFSLDFPPGGVTMTTGIVVCNSSTGATRTGGVADCWFTAVYK